MKSPICSVHAQDVREVRVTLEGKEYVVTPEIMIDPFKFMALPEPVRYKALDWFNQFLKSTRNKLR